MSHRRRDLAGLALAMAAVGCAASPGARSGGDSGTSTAQPDGGPSDSGSQQIDAGSVDAGAADAGPAGTVDAGAFDAGPVEYAQDGTIPYTTQTYQVSNGTLTLNVTGYLPSTPGPHPVVSLSCGSQQTAAGYVPYARRLASYGIAMFMSDDPGVWVNTGTIVPAAIHLVDTWMPATFPGVLDLTKVGLAGHSRGGAVSLLVAEQLPGKVNAWFGIDPVDNEFGMNPTEYARTGLSMIGIPTTFLAAQVIGPCNPAADGYMTLAPLAPTPTTLLIGVNAGHAQFEVASACTACSVCAPDGTADPNVVLSYGVRYFTAFFARELLGDTSVGAQFQGAGLPADIAAGTIQTN